MIPASDKIMKLEGVLFYEAKKKLVSQIFKDMAAFHFKKDMLIISVLSISLSILSLILKLHFVNLNEIIKKKNKNNTSALLKQF